MERNGSLLKRYSSQIAIYYFSGTGNTLLLVKTLIKEFRKHGFEVKLCRLEEHEPQNIELNMNIGLIFPVAAQGTFPFIWNFFKGLPPTEKTPVFLADTMFMYSGGVLGPVKRLIAEKGDLPVGAREFKMPINVFSRRGMTDKKRSKIESTMEKSRDFAAQLIEGNTSWWDIPVYSDLLSVFSRSKRMWSLCRRVIPIRVKKERCVGCGLCLRLCPVGNIDIVTGKPVFLDECVFCMRCYSFCPEEAIYFHNYSGARYRAVKVREIINSK